MPSATPSFSHGRSTLHVPDVGLDTDGSDIDALGVSESSNRDDSGSTRGSPTLFHKVKNQRSILSLAVSESTLFAGTQGGEILVWSLETYELLECIKGHRGAVLGLFLSQDAKLLFSCAGDAIVNIWCTKTVNRLYSIYSTYDVGDIFCVVYSSYVETIYLGAQNTSIQWFDLSRKDSRPPNLRSHPSQRSHRFFDSKGPGGISSPRPSEEHDSVTQGGQFLEIDKSNIVQYAHYGYVYCMLLAKGISQSDPAEDILISGGGDGTIKLWQLEGRSGGTINELATLENGDNSVLSLAINNAVLYAGRLEGEINVWDLDTRQLIQTVKAYKVDVLTLSISHGLMFTGGADGRAKIFERYKCKNEWRAHDELILASTVTNYNGKPYLITGGNDDCVAIWDLASAFDFPGNEVKSSNEQLVQSLTKFVSYRTVSSKPEFAEDCRQGASWLRNLFKRFGAATELMKTDENRNPIVFARFRGRTTTGKRILFYGHYDVIAADDEQLKWKSNPYTLEGRNGYLYGRGVSDNKGPVLAAVYAVADLLAEQKLETDVVFLIEGEEECGSRGFESAVKSNKKLIGHIDWILLANSYWLTDDFPCLTYGLRGVIHATINIENGHKDLHSGVNGSSLMDEPLKDLVMLMAQLTKPGGRINIPGFYDKILPITTAEAQRYSAISKTLLHNSIGGEDAESLKARWREPSLTMHGFKTSGAGNSTIIPHVASAAISFRLVPNQASVVISQTLIDFLHSEFEKLNTSNKLSITTGKPADPWLGDPDNQIFQTLEEAVIEVWGLQENSQPLSPTSPSRNTEGQGKANAKSPTKSPKQSTKKGRSRRSANDISAELIDDAAADPFRIPHKPLYIREGGSIPIIRFLEKEFDAPAAQLPCGQSSDNAHLDNERLRLPNLYNSLKIFKKVFRELPMK